VGIDPGAVAVPALQCKARAVHAARRVRCQQLLSSLQRAVLYSVLRAVISGTTCNTRLSRPPAEQQQITHHKVRLADVQVYSQASLRPTQQPQPSVANAINTHLEVVLAYLVTQVVVAQPFQVSVAALNLAHALGMRVARTARALRSQNHAQHKAVASGQLP
jgi:hypothetical protein